MAYTVSASEREFIVGGVAVGVRCDGRAPGDYRPFRVETGIIEQANGSARVRLGRTDVLVGVKAEIGAPDPGRPLHGVITCSVDLPSMSSNVNGGGGTSSASSSSGGSDFTSWLESFLADALTANGAVDTRALSLAEGAACWHVAVDASVIDQGGNCVDAVFLAARAALVDARLPRASVIPSTDNSGAIELEVADDPTDGSQLPARGAPICVTVSALTPASNFSVADSATSSDPLAPKIALVVDASPEEEACAAGRVHVAVSPSGAVVAIAKSGRGAVPGSAVAEAMRLAGTTSAAVHAGLEGEIQKEQSSGGDAFLVPNRMLAATGAAADDNDDAAMLMD